MQHNILPYAGGSRNQPTRFWDEVAAYHEAQARIRAKHEERAAMSSKLDSLLGDI